MVDRIRHDLHTRRLLLFRDQGQLPAHVQLKVSEWFGTVQSTFYRHPRSPHPDIFRVSNDERQGCRNVGRSGWHIDGSFQDRPFKVQAMHFWETSEGGDTLFSPLLELIERLDEPTRVLWKRLFFVANGATVIHPLIYPHPVTGKDTMCFHCGKPFCETFAIDYDPMQGRATSGVLSATDTHGVLDQLNQMLSDPAWCYRMCWRQGDFALVDNLALAHYATADTQRDVKEVGLRILHRTTIAGDKMPMCQRFKPSPPKTS